MYHLPKALEALEPTKAVAREHVVLDTVVLPTSTPLIRVRWEEPADIRDTATAGISMIPSRSSVDLMLRHVKFTDWPRSRSARRTCPTSRVDLIAAFPERRTVDGDH